MRRVRCVADDELLHHSMEELFVLKDITWRASEDKAKPFKGSQKLIHVFGAWFQKSSTSLSSNLSQHKET